VASAQDAEIFRLPEEIPAQYWLQVWRAASARWKTVALFAICGAALGLIIASARTPLYHAVTSIEVQGITDNLLKSQDGNPNAGADAELMDLQTQIRIMQSGSMLDAVVKKLAAPGQQTALQEARLSLNVHVAGQTRILEIAADSSNPRIAADFVNTLAEAYIDQHVEARWQGAQLGAQKLQRALDDMRVKLETSEDALSKYARDSGLLLSGDRGAVNDDKLRLLQTELTQAQGDRVIKQSRFDAVAAASDADLPAVANSPAIQDIEAKLTDLRRQLAELGATYTPGYSKVQRVQAQMDPLEAAIRKQLAGTKERTRSEFQEARQRERLLGAAYQAEVESLARNAEKKVHYDALRREVDSTRGLYDVMLSRVKEASIGAALRASNVRVLDPARAAAAPFQPRRARMSLLGGLAGMILGAAFAGARQQTDRRLRNPGELHSLLNVREFAAIPSSTSPGFTEALECLRASLLLDVDDNAARGQAIVITSAESGEGKTTVACGLAASLARIGKRVLLIDGDLRCPRLHTLLHTANDSGLADLLASPLPLLDLQVAQVLRATAQPKLELLSSGPVDPHSADLLYSSRLPELMAYGRNNFDIVLIDSPPMVQIPDARILGRAAGAVLAVVRARKTDREPVFALRQRLLEDRTRLTGIVLNDCHSGPAKKAVSAADPDSSVRPGRIPGLSSLSTAARPPFEGTPC
jgi:capsular exopolysaccharide synthesis family protein